MYLIICVYGEIVRVVQGFLDALKLCVHAFEGLSEKM